MTAARAKTLSFLSPAADLVSLALALGARDVAGWSDAERSIAERAEPARDAEVALARQAIEQGGDPLGDRFCELFTADERRPNGATYTPQPIVEAMLSWASDRARPARIVDPGAGSARFLVAAGRRFPDAELIAAEIDPLAAVLARGRSTSGCVASRRSMSLAGSHRGIGFIAPIWKKRTDGVH